MSKLCDEPRQVTNPNRLIGSYFAADLPDISPDDQRAIDNTERKLGTNSFSWRGVLFSRPSRWERTSALQLSEETGRVRYSVRAVCYRLIDSSTHRLIDSSTHRTCPRVLTRSP